MITPASSDTPLRHEVHRYYLRAYPHPDFPYTGPPKFSGLYIRLHESGTNSMMLTPSPPIYLRGHSKPTGIVESASIREIVVSWGDNYSPLPLKRHRGRRWGRVLATDSRDYKAVAGWDRAEIVESPKTAGWAFESVQLRDEIGEMASREQLVWKGTVLSVSPAAEPDEV